MQLSIKFSSKTRIRAIIIIMCYISTRMHCAVAYLSLGAQFAHDGNHRGGRALNHDRRGNHAHRELAPARVGKRPADETILRMREAGREEEMVEKGERRGDPTKAENKTTRTWESSSGSCGHVKLTFTLMGLSRHQQNRRYIS